MLRIAVIDPHDTQPTADPVRVGRLFATLTAVAVLAIASGCASIPMATKDQDAVAKTFPRPDATKVGLYLFRDSFGGQALRKNLSLDGQLIGATANKTYFVREVEAGRHLLTTQSEFGDNELQLDLVGGRNYFVRQYIKMGVFVGGSDVELVSEEEGRKAVLACELAQPVEPGQTVTTAPAPSRSVTTTTVAVASAPAANPARAEPPRWSGQAKKPRAVPIDDFPAPTPAPAAIPARAAERNDLAVVSASLLKYRGAAERLARETACHADPVASLTAIAPLAEIYTVACTTGEPMIVRCDANACRAMQ